MICFGRESRAILPGVEKNVFLNTLVKQFLINFIPLQTYAYLLPLLRWGLNTSCL